jgi:tRNA pseudouridine38-40 synthase
MIEIVMIADRFLYKMARTLVGTLACIGQHKIVPSDILRLLSSRDRTLAGMTAPACGLFLHQIFYENLNLDYTARGLKVGIMSERCP